MEDLKLTILEERHGRINILTKWMLRLGMALLFIFTGKSKFDEHSNWIGIFDQIGFGSWFRYFTGMIQIAGGLLVLIPKTFAFGILILACTMIGAMCAWVFFLHAPFNALVPGLLLLGLVALGGEDLRNLKSRWMRK